MLKSKISKLKAASYLATKTKDQGEVDARLSAASSTNNTFLPLRLTLSSLQRLSATVLFTSILFMPPSLWAVDIKHIYTFWQSEDTAHTMSIGLWAGKKSKLHVDFWLAGQATTIFQTATMSRDRRAPDGVFFYKVELTNLIPNSSYSFVVNDLSKGSSDRFSFRTLPEGKKPISFIQGGDIGVDGFLEEFNQKLQTLSPHAILIGGDISYANGKDRKWKKWDKWFTRMKPLLMSPERQLTPLIVAVGNHEVNLKVWRSKRGRAPFYFTFFPQNGKKSYFTRKLGSHSRIVVLDSGHLYGHDDQVNWLRSALGQAEKNENLFALYHVPLYPSHRNYSGYLSGQGREHWAPLFDRFRLDVAFENHDHALKRTFPLKNGRIHDNGTVYLGDGCWGKGGRSTEDRWYLRHHSSETHVWYGQIGPKAIKFEAIDRHGQVLDTFEKAQK